MEHGKQRRSHLADLICHGSATKGSVIIWILAVALIAASLLGDDWGYRAYGESQALGNLSIHRVGLAFGTQPSSRIDNASNSGNEQEVVREDPGLIPVVLIVFFFSCVLDAWAVWLLWSDGRSLAGWVLLGILVVLLGCCGASFWIGCFPWNWHRCLCDGKDHGQYREAASVTGATWNVGEAAA